MKSLKRIKNNFIERNTSLMKLAFKSGTGLLFKGKDPTEILMSIIGKNPEEFSDELAMYKGSILKAGQLLSLYGEYYLPKEINSFLENLKSQTHYLDFDVIKGQIPDHIFKKIDIDRTPIAAASIGQVHVAFSKADPSQKYAVKIQYKGIEKAIGTDMFFIKMLLKSTKFLPKGMSFDDVFSEIKRILVLETDYKNEAQMIGEYARKIEENLGDLDKKIVHMPEVFPELSTDKVLTLEYMSGVTLDKYCLTQNDQQFSNTIGQFLFKIFLLEIFKFSLVQTDAHGGNYLVDVENKKLNLIDFGACVKYSESEMSFYQSFIYTSVNLEEEKFFETMDRFFEESNNRLTYDRELLWEYVCLATGPLRSRDFDWGETKIPDQLLELGLRLEKTVRAKKVPHQFIFIDKKVVGLFMILKKLKARFDVFEIFKEVTKSYKN